MIYFDNSATTFPKPQCVLDEVRRCMATYCGNPGRSGHSLSLAAAKKVFECRELASELFGASDPDRIFFTPNTTYGINAVIKGILKDGDHVIISDMEHNAVWRPIHKLAAEGKITYSIFKSMTAQDKCSPLLVCANIAKHITPKTKMVVCAHASNICSARLHIKEIGAFCHRHGIFFLVDGAQSAGHIPINITEMNIDALCVRGHKGLYGPQGSGLVVLGDNVSLDTLIEGGNGINSLSPEMPDDAPERYEAGTLSTPCIAGLWAGLRYVREQTPQSIFAHEEMLCKRALELLGNTRGITVYAPQYLGSNILWNINDQSSEAVASALNERNICVRGGYHCAPLAHKTLGTPEGGAVRLSLGAFNRQPEIDGFYQVLKNLL